MPRLREEPLVTIARFETSIEADLAKGALEAVGIRALVPEDALFRRGVVVTPATLQVFASDRSRAEAALGRMQMRIVRGAEDDGATE
jgi:hypothetical protein